MTSPRTTVEARLSPSSKVASPAALTSCTACGRWRSCNRTAPTANASTRSTRIARPVPIPCGWNTQATKLSTATIAASAAISVQIADLARRAAATAMAPSTAATQKMPPLPGGRLAPSSSANRTSASAIGSSPLTSSVE